MSKVLKIKNARLSFPSLFKRAMFEGKEGKFEATFLFPKSDTETYDMIKAEIERCAKEAKVKVPESKMCIKDGDDFDYAGYEGHWAVKCANTIRPKLLNKDKSPILEEDGILYAGCYVNVLFDIWIQNNSYGKRANANLLGLQFAKDGEPLGGGSSVADEDDFDCFDDDELDDEL